MVNLLANIKTEAKEVLVSKQIIKGLVYSRLFGNYKNTTLGFCWHFVSPLLLLVVYYIVFVEIRSTPIDHFLVFLSSVMFPFNFLLGSFTGGAGCIISNASMIRKMYFPRSILVLSHIISNLIIMCIGYLIVAVIIVVDDFSVNGLLLLLLPFEIIMMAVFGTGCSLFFSAVTVYWRDVQYILTSITTLLLFVSPVYFMASNVGGLLGEVIWYNPFTYFIEPLHYIIYLGELPPVSITVVQLVLTAFVFVLGTVVFIKLKNGFTERV